MKKVVMLVLTGLTVVVFGAEKRLEKSFTGIDEINIKTVSGDCIVRPARGHQVIVGVVYDVDKEKAFEPQITQRGETLNIRERWYGSSSGDVRWSIGVPDGIKVDFSTASGDIRVEDIKVELEAGTASGDIALYRTKGEIEAGTASGDVMIESASGEFDISTASGDIEVNDVDAELELSTASGDIEVENAEGDFDLSSAGGDIEAENVTLKEDASFSAASGSVLVVLDESATFDLDISSASGDAVLDYNGNPLKGRFVVSARKERGEIVSTVAFNEKNEIDRNGTVYIEKSYSKGGDSPVVRIETSTGRAELKE